MENEARIPEEHTFATFDGTELFYRHWKGKGNKAIVLFHRGHLIYTNQPWHPQLELIARTLTSHRQNQSWVMRRRTQQEMDQLVAEAGFDKVDQYSDEWGIFSVSLARRR